MASSSVDKFIYAISPTVRSFEKIHPGESVVFSSVATLSEFTGQSRTGVFRRGNLFLTQDKIYFGSVLLSAYSLFYIATSIFCFYAFLNTFDLWSLFGGILVGSMLNQRLPLQRDILFSEIKEAKLDTIRGGLLAGRKIFHRLTITTEKKKQYFHCNQRISDEILQKIGLAVSNTSMQVAG